MDPTKLNHFLAVLEAGHFARAAAKLGISQPAVSKSIRVLEDDLGVRLFERGQFGAEPTDYARRLAIRAKLILAEGRIARAELAALAGGKKGHLAIGVGISFAARIAPMAVARFARRWPDVVLRVETGMSADLYACLCRGDLDLVVSAPPVHVRVPEELAREPLFDEHDVIVCGPGHPLIDAPPSTLADLAPYPWVVSPATGLWQYVCSRFVEAGLTPPHRYVEASSDVFAKALMGQGPYLCLLGRELFAPEAAQRQLFEVPLDGFGGVRPAFLTTRRRSPLPLAARNMISVIKSLTAVEPPR